MTIHLDVPLPGERKLVSLVRERLAGRRLVVVSNREPVIHCRGADGAIETQQPASGLTTAMLPVVRACGGTWVAHGSGSADFDVTDARDGFACRSGGTSFRLRRVRLTSEIERGYYYGLANEGLWPLCHIAYTAPIFRHRDWAMYQRANELFADAVLDEIGSEPAAVVINDYHFALLPRLLRRARPDLLIALFWHIPWPNREVIRVMPWAADLLDGLLGADLLGFHVRHHSNNFLETVDRGIEALIDVEHDRATRDGHATFVRALPISIDARRYAEIARAQSFAATFPDLHARVGDRLLLLGVDRLDYTKGIPHRLRIFESMLATNPDLRGRACLVQVGAPTRTEIDRYRALADEVRGLVERINARYESRGWTPVIYLHEHHDRDRLAALYRRADACLVTSLHDGMNLVAKEYVAAQDGCAGTLLLSRYTGAARELHEACLVNPYDVEGSASALAEALAFPEKRRAEAMAKLTAQVCERDVFDWAGRLFNELADVERRRSAQSWVED